MQPNVIISTCNQFTSFNNWLCYKFSEEKNVGKPQVITTETRKPILCQNIIFCKERKVNIVCECVYTESKCMVSDARVCICLGVLLTM